MDIIIGALVGYIISLIYSYFYTAKQLSTYNFNEFWNAKIISREKYNIIIKRDQAYNRAIKMWIIKHPDQKDTVPNQCDLVIWLLEEFHKDNKQ